MKIPHSIAELVSDFSSLNRTPPFRPTRSSLKCQCEGSSSTMTTTTTTTTTSVGGGDGSRADSTSPVQEYNRKERRHSINIAVGVDAVPVVVPQQPAQPDEPSTAQQHQTDQKRFEKYSGRRRQSAPCVSAVAVTTCLKEKMNRIRRTNSSGSDGELREEDEEEFHRMNDSSRKASATSYRVIKA